MGLTYYKRTSFQTDRSPENILRVFSDITSKRRSNAEIEKLLSNNWNVTINFNDNRFNITIERDVPWHARAGIGSVLKGKIQQNKMTGLTKISTVIRPSDQYLFSLGIIFFFLTMVLFYAVSNNIMPVIVISSILLFAWYFGFLIDFNLQVKAYKRIIDSCFN